MGKFNIRRIGIALAITVLISVLALVKYYYFDVYSMSLNGRIKTIQTTIKQTMHITVANKEYNLEHYWPVLQENVEVGDSVNKQPNQYDIILIKWQTRKKIICHYEDYNRTGNQ